MKTKGGILIFVSGLAAAFFMLQISVTLLKAEGAKFGKRIASDPAASISSRILTTLDGESKSIDSNKVIINWATWNEPSVEKVREAASSTKNDSIYFVSVGEDPLSVKNFLEKRKIDTSHVLIEEHING